MLRVPRSLTTTYSYLLSGTLTQADFKNGQVSCVELLFFNRGDTTEANFLPRIFRHMESITIYLGHSTENTYTAQGNVTPASDWFEYDPEPERTHPFVRRVRLDIRPNNIDDIKRQLGQYKKMWSDLRIQMLHKDLRSDWDRLGHFYEDLDNECPYNRGLLDENFVVFPLYQAPGMGHNADAWRWGFDFTDLAQAIEMGPGLDRAHPQTL